MNPRDIESTLHIEILNLGSKGSGDSVLAFMHVTYLAHSLCTYIQLTSVPLHAQVSPPDYCSGLGSVPSATAHAQNVLHSKVHPKKNLRGPSTALSLSKVRSFAHFLKQRKTGEIWNI